MFEHPYKNNAKRPQYDGISSSTRLDNYSKQEEKSTHKIAAKKQTRKNNINDQVGYSDYFAETKEEIKPVSKKTVEPEPKRVVKPETTKPSESASKKSVSSVKKSEAPVIQRKYAIYPDSPVGFLDVHLSDEQGDIYVYELQFHSNSDASFIIVNNPSAHQKAISNSSFILKNACQYLNSITSGNKIQTITKGYVKKSGDVWKITQKADIKFV